MTSKSDHQKVLDTIHKMMYSSDMMLFKLGYNPVEKKPEIVFIDETRIYISPEYEQYVQLMKDAHAAQHKSIMFNKVMDSFVNEKLGFKLKTTQLPYNLLPKLLSEASDGIHPLYKETYERTIKSSIIKEHCEQQGLELEDFHMNRDESIEMQCEGIPKFEGCPHGCPDAPKQHKFSCPY